MIRRSRSTESSGAFRGSGYFLMAGLLLSIGVPAFGWGPGSHNSLTQNIFDDAGISAFLTEFSINQSAIESGSDDLDVDKNNGWGEYHDGQWTTFVNREYVDTTSKWYDTGMDETRRLKYLMHNVFDVGVPIGHSPANTVYVNSTAENWLELQVETWSDYPTVSTTSTNLTGTITQVGTQFWTLCRNNATWLKSKSLAPWGGHWPDDNRTAGWEGTSISMDLARAFLTDYFLAKRDVIAEAGSGYTVTPSGSATFSSAGSQDPDSIAWAANATYSNNGGGIASVAWDLDNDGQYDDATGSSANLSHSQLVALAGYSETGKTISVQITDDEGKTATDTSTIKVYSDPTVSASATYTTLKRNQTLYLNGSGSDADGGGISSYAWDLDNDGQYDDATTSSPEISYATLANLGLSAGNNYTVAMQGTDNDGAYAGQGTDSFTLTMDTGYNVAPQAVATASSVYPGGGWYAEAVNDELFGYNPWECWNPGANEPHWVKLEWDEEILFDEVKLYSIGYTLPNAEQYTTADFLIQIWDGDSWETIDTVVDNLDLVYTFESETVYSTDAIRIYITDANYYDTDARLLEIEVGNYSGQMPPVPEPVTLVTLALGGAFCLRRRKK